MSKVGRCLILFVLVVGILTTSTACSVFGIEVQTEEAAPAPGEEMTQTPPPKPEAPTAVPATQAPEGEAEVSQAAATPEGEAAGEVSQPAATPEAEGEASQPVATPEVAGEVSQPAAPAFVLFDAECWLCSSAIRRICRNDPLRKFVFVPRDSALARELLCGAARPDSLMLVENGRIFAHSTACLRISRQLRFPWRLLYCLIVIPRPIRDWVYRCFAAVRYRLFGRSGRCELLTADCADRIVG